MEEPAEILRILEQLIVESPTTAADLLGWQPGQDRLEQADFSPVIRHVLIVRFTPRA